MKHISRIHRRCAITVTVLIMVVVCIVLECNRIGAMRFKSQVQRGSESSKWTMEVYSRIGPDEAENKAGTMVIALNAIRPMEEYAFHIHSRKRDHDTVIQYVNSNGTGYRLTYQSVPRDTFDVWLSIDGDWIGIPGVEAGRSILIISSIPHASRGGHVRRELGLYLGPT